MRSRRRLPISISSSRAERKAALRRLFVMEGTWRCANQAVSWEPLLLEKRRMSIGLA
jgi:hypothetical protein